MSSFQIFNNVPFPSPIQIENEQNGNIYVDSRENTVVNTRNPYASTAFGENITAKLTPVIQLQFPYFINPNNVIQFTNGSGSLTNINSQLNLTSGTTILSDAALASKDFITYQPGVGALARFTAGFTTGNQSIGTFQQIGVGNQEDGFFFSYTSNDMNIIIRKGGLRTQYTLEITTGATLGGDIILTLNGNAQNITVTTGGINTNATEIATYNFPFYRNSSNGNTVNIIAQRTGTQSGTFSFNANGTGMVATLTQQVTGVQEQTTTINRSNWNKDTCDNTDYMPLIDWSKGNVFQIKYQWLGYGVISFYIENPTNGYLTLVHEYLYPNTNTTPSINNPSLQFLVNVANALTTNNVSMFCSSVGCFIEGDVGLNGGNIFGNHIANTFSNSLVGNTIYENIVSFRNPPYFQNTSTRAVVLILRITVTVSTATTIKILRNPTLTSGTDWTATSNQLIETSISAGNVSNDGELVYIERGEKQDRFVIEPLKIDNSIVKIHPGDFITIAGKADTGSSSVVLAVNWLEPV